VGSLEIALGIDIGQKRDPTAICVAEFQPRKTQGRDEMHFIVRHLQRLDLGTPYPEVARRVAEVAEGTSKKAGISPVVYVDATGVGQPIVDILRECAPRYLKIIPVYFTSTDKATVSTSYPPQISLGKAFLVSRLQALLQTGRLHLPQSRDSEALREELLNYEIRITENSNDTYGAFRVGTHDDLVTALGMAVQADKPPGVMRCGASSSVPGW